MVQPRGSSLVVGTETGVLLLYSLTGGAYQFKCVLRGDFGAPIHALSCLDRSRIAVAFGNQMNVIHIGKSSAAELAYRIPSENDSITSVACTPETIILGCEYRGTVVLDSFTGLEIGHVAPPPGDAISSVAGQSVAGSAFIVATRRGALISCRANGSIMGCTTVHDALPSKASKITSDGSVAPILSPHSELSQQTTDQNYRSGIGGIYLVSFCPYGGAFLALGFMGLLVGYAPPQRISSGYLSAEVIDREHIQITDARLQVTERYAVPEPIISLFISAFAENVRIGATTATSIIIWNPPSTRRTFDQDLKMGLVAKVQWITDPLRSTSYSDMIQTKSSAPPKAKPTASQPTLLFEGLTEGSNPSPTPGIIEEKKGHCSNAPTKTAAYLRNSPALIFLGDSCHVIVDISGEANIISSTTLAVIATIYAPGVMSIKHAALIDSAFVYVENGNVLRVIDPKTGNYIIRGANHPKPVRELAIGISVAQKMTLNVNGSQTSTAPVNGFSLSNVFGMITGSQGLGSTASNPVVPQKTTSTTDESTSEASKYILALLDSGYNVYTGRLTTSASTYQKINNSPSSSILSQTKYPNAMPLSIKFVAHTDILALLVPDTGGMPPAATQIGETTGSDCKLRLILDTYPVRSNITTEEPVFVSPSVLDYSSVQKAIASVSVFEEDPSRILAAYKMFCRAGMHSIIRVTPLSLKRDSSIGNVSIMSHAAISLCAGASTPIIPLSDFCVILKYLCQADQTDHALRLCRFLDQRPLWAQMASYSVERENVSSLESALSGLGMVAKASYCHGLHGESPGAIKLVTGDPEGVDLLMRQGKISQAIVAACDLWNFSKALEICKGHKRYLPLLVHLRTRYYGEIGLTNCNDEDPWATLEKQYGSISTDEVNKLMAE